MSGSSTTPGASDPEAGSLLDLKRLHALRWIAIAVEVAGVLLIARWPGAHVALVPALATCAAQAAAQAAGAGVPLRSARRRDEPAARELFLQLLIDVLALTGVAYFAGGASNPLVTLYLPLIAIGATILPARLAWLLAAGSVACYTIVAVVGGHVHAEDAESAFRAHLIGMWLIFVISAAIIVAFVIRMAGAIRRRDAELATARENALRNERVIALGNLAAGAAHELGTPLATTAVLVGELRRSRRLPKDVRVDLDLVALQVQECKRIISQLTIRAGRPRAADTTPVPVDEWLAKLVERWQLQRAPLVASLAVHGEQPVPRIAADPALDQAIVSIINNAADASPGEVALEARWDPASLAVDVLDRGPGIAPDIARRLGTQPVTTHGEGRGIGIMLARATLQRFHGTLSHAERAGGGTVARIVVPLAAISAMNVVAEAGA